MTEAHTQRAHAKLSPSGSHRWIACPGSIRMSEGIAERSSVFAAEGTAAHELCAHCIDHGLDPADFLGTVIDIAGKGPGAMFGNKGLADGETRFEVDEEMVESAQVYIDLIHRICGGAKHFELDVEQRLDMTHIHPGIFGTGDAVIYDEEGAHLHVCDFKYGKGVAVDVKENPQLLTYGAGAARRYGNRPLKKITLWVVQPRAAHRDGPVRSWEADLIDLLEFEDELGAAARRTEEPEAPLSAGEHCRFCPARGICTAYRDRAFEAAVAEFSEDEEVRLAQPEQMTPEQFAKALKDADLLNNWIKAIQQHAHDEAVAGRPVPGFKLVAKRATRKWKDEDAVKDTLLLEYGLGDGDIYAEPKMKSPAQMEKVVGKKRFGGIEAEHVVKESSGSNLVPDSDPRPALKADAASEFAD